MCSKTIQAIPNIQTIQWTIRADKTAEEIHLQGALEHQSLRMILPSRHSNSL